MTFRSSSLSPNPPSQLLRRLCSCEGPKRVPFFTSPKLRSDRESVGSPSFDPAPLIAMLTTKPRESEDRGAYISAPVITFETEAGHSLPQSLNCIRLTSDCLKLIRWSNHLGCYKLLFCSRAGYVITHDTRENLERVFSVLYERRDKAFGNARLARNIFETTLSNQANRIVSIPNVTVDILSAITMSDLPGIAELQTMHSG